MVVRKSKSESAVQEQNDVIASGETVSAADTELMTDDMFIDFTNFLQQEAEAPSGGGSDSDSREGQILNVVNTKHLGVTVFALIPDKVLTKSADGSRVPRLLRKVTDCYDGSIDDPEKEDRKMNIQIPRAEDFICTLTSGQKGLLEKLRGQAKIFADLTSFKKKDMWPEISKKIFINYCSQIAFCYGKYLRFIPEGKGEIESPELGHMRVMKFAKGQVGKDDFITSLNNAIKTKVVAKGGTTWMKHYFNRTVGEHDKAIYLTVSQANTQPRKYTLLTAFEETATYEITEADLAIAENLNSRVFNIEAFDPEYYDKLEAAFAGVQKIADDLCSE